MPTVSQKIELFKNCLPHPRTKCWVWTSTYNPEGYGRIVIKGRFIGAHRISYEQHTGLIPAGQIVRHRCDNPRCVNPEHLELGTQKENIADCISRGRRIQRGSSRPGEKNPAALLTADQVRIIRSRSESYSKMATRFGVHKSTIAAIIARRLWSHLDG